MAVSGTTAFDLDIVEIIEEAYEQAEIDPRTGYDMRSARRSLDLLFLEWGNRGYNLWTVVQQSLPLTPGIGVYALTPDLIDLIEFSLRDNNGNRDTPLRRIPLGVHAHRHDQSQRGRPSQIYIERLRTGPVVNLWPLPNDNAATLIYWALRRINDTGSFTNTVDTPSRFLPALITGLAHKLSIKKNPQKASYLQGLAGQLWTEATDEDRDRSDLLVYPEFY